MGINIRKQATDNGSGNPSGVRIGKTADGRFVPIDHPEAKFLAYTEHDAVPDEVLAGLGAKQAPKPADKQAAKGADKSRRPRSNKRKSTEEVVEAGVSPEEGAEVVELSYGEDESGD